MKKNNILIVAFIVLTLLSIFAIFYYKEPITGKAIIETCGGTAACNYPNSNSCNSHCACTWDSSTAECTYKGCSSCSSQTSCEASGCSWQQSTSETGDEGIQKVVGVISRYPLGGDSVIQGPLQLRVQVYYAGEPSNSATVKANSTMFGKIELKHAKNLPEGIYAADVIIKRNIEPGPQRITYTATQGTQYDESSVLVNLEHGLNTNANLNDKYFKGTRMELTGKVTSLNKTLEKNADIIISAYEQENKIFELQTKTNDTGYFSTYYLIKHADPEGLWDIKISALSETNYSAVISMPVEIDISPSYSYYAVNFLSPLKDSSFGQGDLISLTIEVKEEEFPVENASVTIYTPKEKAIALKETSSGIYSGKYIVDENDEIGNWYLRAEVVKDIGGVKVGGGILPIKISPTEIKIALLLPTKDIIYTYSNLKIKAKLTYSDGSPAKGADARILLSNGENITLTERSDGIFSGNYFITAKDVGSLKIEIITEDINRNLGGLEKTFVIRKRSFIGNMLSYAWEGIKKYWWAVILFVIISAYLYKSNIEINWIKRKLRKTKERQKQIQIMQIDLEKKYYKRNSITKNNFQELSGKYEEELTKEKEKQKISEKRLQEILKNIKKKL